MHNNPSDPRAQKRPLVTAPFQKLEKAAGKDGILERHQKLQCCPLALEAGITIIRGVQKPKETLPYRISTRNQEMFEKKNMNAPRAIISTIILCGRQNIPLRGHRDDSTSMASNKGNFHAILMLLGNSDKNLQEHLLTGGRNATSTSKTVQEEVIRITGEYIRAKVTQQIQREDTFFSIIGDEVTDKYANQEILSVYLRFLDPNNDVSPKIKEVFFDYVNLDKTTGESMANAILSSLAENNIDVAFARGQAYNCASAMSSEACGMQGKIWRIAPMALYTHCNSHVLNLSVAAACRLPKSET